MAAFGSSGEGERNPNNGMHPTGRAWMSSASLDASLNASRRVMPGVMSPHRVESMKSPAASQLNAVEVMWIMRRWLNIDES
jgi:hypothetical protein